MASLGLVDLFRSLPKCCLSCRRLKRERTLACPGRLLDFLEQNEIGLPTVSVIWLNGTVGSGKSTVGRALADIMPRAVFRDGDDYAGPEHFPSRVRWRMALDALLRVVAWPGRFRVIVIAYPLESSGYARLRAISGRAHHKLVVVNLATPLATTLRGRGGRQLGAEERARVRVMRSEGYHKRPFASLTLPNARRPAARTARLILSRLRQT
jgi:hypothetical protein